MPVDLGDIGKLATALGLLDERGNLTLDWFQRPAHYLTSVLRTPHQRRALVTFADEVLGGSEATDDPSGRHWLPIVEAPNGKFTGYLVVDPDGAGGGSGSVGIGVGVRVRLTSESGLRCAANVVVPLFSQGAGGIDVVLGDREVTIDVELELSFPSATTSAGVGLAGVSLAAAIPTGSDEEPSFSLVLKGLALPGAAAPRDLTLTAARVADLDDALLQMVLGLVRAQAAALSATSPLRGLATMLGLGDDAVPDFPIEDVLARGSVALMDWLAQALVDPVARAAWLAGLANLLNGRMSVAGAATVVVVDLPPAELRLSIDVTAGTAGRPRITPHASLSVAGAPGVTLAVDVDPVVLDLGTGSAVALPRLSLAARITGGAHGPLLPPADTPAGLPVGVGELRAGFCLDPARRPMLLLEARNAVVGSTSFAVLDLTSPDALAGAAEDIVRDVARNLLTRLGPAATVVGVLVGLEDPPGGPALPAIDPARLLTDPLGALAARWAALLAGPAGHVRRVLELLRDVVADAGQHATPVGGTGTASDPWRVPMASGVVLTVRQAAGAVAVGVEVRVGVPGLLGTDVSAAFELEATLAEVSLVEPLGGAFLPAASGRLRLAGPGGGPLTIGTPPAALAVNAVGIELRWRASEGLSVQPLLDGARLVLPSGPLALPALVLGPDGTLTLDEEGWVATERLVGAAAQAAAATTGALWLLDAVRLLGWEEAAPAGVAGTAGEAPRLRLAELVADPAAALSSFAATLLDVAETAGLEATLDLLATLVGSATGRRGAGRPGEPWRLPLLGDEADALADRVPALLAHVLPEGPEGEITRLRGRIVSWQPGDPGLDFADLVAAIGTDAAIDEELRDLLAGRADPVTGLQQVASRLVGTDGMVTLPEAGLPDGVTAHRIPDLLHTSPVTDLDLAAFAGSVPATVVYVAVVAEGLPDVLPEGIAADHTVDLTGAGLPPQAFAPVLPADPTGRWNVRLAGRAACRLPAADPDGVAGQAARLARLLAPLAAARPVLVVAHGAAGHAAVRAATGLAAGPGRPGGVTAVVTVGAPWSTVSVETLDGLESGDALRLLGSLLPPEDANEPDDDDLATARALLNTWLALNPADPLAELRPSVTVRGTGTDGPPVHAVAGSLALSTVQRAMTAVVAAALAGRARARAGVDPPPPAGARWGLRLPVVAPGARGGLHCSVHADLDLEGGGGGPRLVVRFALSSAAGWLVGGPGPGRTAGTARPLALRRLTGSVSVPLGAGTGGTGAPEARLDLHDFTAFGVQRPRWTLARDPAAPATPVPVLPEVRAVLGEVARRIAAVAAADATVAALRDGLVALGLLAPDGGVDAISLERLLNDPAGVVAALRADTGRRASLAAAVRALAGDARPAGLAGDTVNLLYRAASSTSVSGTLDVGTGSISVSATGRGGVPWALTIGAGAAVTARLRLGPDLPAPGTPEAADPAAPLGLALLVDTAPMGARLRVRRARSVEDVRVWPTPDAAAVARVVGEGVPAAALHLALEGVRSALAGRSPAAASGFDALLDALGLLSPPSVPVEAPRALRLPAGLLVDPGAWLGTSAVPTILDAVRALLGAGGAPGTLHVTPGLLLRAEVADGRLGMGVAIDGSTFAAAGTGAGRLVLDGSALLSLPTGTVTGRVLPDVAATVAIGGVGQVRLRVAPDAAGTLSVQLSLVPDAGAEIPILPAGPGLGGSVTGAAAGAAVRALPALLDAVAQHDPPAASAPATAPQLAGRLVARLGDALDLRTGSPGNRIFSPSALSTFAGDPAAALAARATAVAGTGLDLLTQAIGPLLGPSRTRRVAVASGALAVTAGPLTVRWTPSTARVEATLTAPAGVPGVHRLELTAAVGHTGVAVLDVAVGPAELAAGPLVVRPFARVRAGSAVPGGPGVEVGLVLDGTRRLVASWDFSPAPRFRFLVMPGELTSDEQVALAAIAAVVDLAGSLVLSVPAVSTALEAPVLGTTARALLAGVFLDAAAPTRLDPALLDPDRLMGRVGRLLANLAAAPGATVPIGPLTVGPHVSGPAGGPPVYGVKVATTAPVPLGGTDITVSLDSDPSWVRPPGGGTVRAGLELALFAMDAAGTVTVQPALTVGGLGLRFARSLGPLLDAGVKIESVAIHAFASVRVGPSGTPEVAGGARVQVDGMSVSLAGASGGDNAVARGLMASAGTGDDAPRPRFSPALAVQKHGNDPAFVTLTAGDGAGPWWLVVQRGFGPIYIEQVGLTVTMLERHLGSFGVMVDGRVSLLGLTASVDDLSISYVVASGLSPLDPGAWRIDLAGLAVTADLPGLSLAGGLRKFPSTSGGVEYLGMLMARVAVYGITVYGGYGMVGPAEDRFASLFLFGAINGPIGGPPAFFVTGIGGGFGVNRALTYPSDLSQFGNYPFIKALDPASRPGDPMRELQDARVYFPAQRGTLWFAAGLSFTSFSLVDGVAVVAVQVDGGFELALLGLARMALPRPEVALVSVELGLLGRFSTSEGKILVQAQLTDNSWILFPGIKLTGGFAFASWFSGPNRGQFVLTLGGYHPSFHREGYPSVPRLGITYRIGPITIAGRSYFALTSEAVMAGTQIEVSARFGPAWAHLLIGGDGVIFFDPFWLEVTVFASISAGVTIDVWIGEITISISLSARVTLKGPPFHGRASFSVGPVELTVEFGDVGREPQEIRWERFVAKYLEEARPGVAHVLVAVPGRGAMPPAGSASTGGSRSPDGTDARPFRVAPEFELTVTSTAPVRELAAGGPLLDLPTTPEVAAAPMRQPAKPRVTLTFVGPAHASPTDRINRLVAQPQRLGAFPIGAWGPAQSRDDAKVPRGDVLAAVDRVLLRADAQIATSPSGEPAIRYRQVETDPLGRRRPLPFVTEGSAGRRQALTEGAQELAQLVPTVGSGQTAIDVARVLLRERAGRSPADVAAWSGDRASVPLLGSLAEGLGRPSVDANVDTQAPVPAEVAPLRPPVVAAVLAAAASTPPVKGGRQPWPGASATGAGAAAIGPHTTVDPELYADLPDLLVSAPPRLSDVDARLEPAVAARLVQVAPPGVSVESTVLATRAVPTTRSGRSGVESIGGRGNASVTADRLRQLTGALHDERAEGRSAAGGLPVNVGEVAVLSLPDAARDVDGKRRPRLVVEAGVARVVALAPAQVAADTLVAEGASLAVPPGTRVLAVAAVDSLDNTPDAAHDAFSVRGWDVAGPLPYLGDEVFLGAGCIVRSAGRVPRRAFTFVRTGWVAPGEVVSGTSAVTTEFTGTCDLIAIAVEGGEGDDFAMGLDGGARPVGDGGRPEPPIVVADGPRAVALYPVVHVAAAGGTQRFAVTVTTGASRRLAAVAAVSGATPQQVAEAVGRRGVAALVPEPVPSGTGRAVVTWKAT